MRYTVRLVGAFFALSVFWLAATSRAGEDGQDQPRKQARAERLAKMRAQAELFQFSLVAKDQKARLKSEPVFRYDDQPRGFVDATLWVWEVDDLPVAIAKVEDIRVGRAIRWQFCMASLWADRIRMTGPGAHRWTAKQPGLKFSSIPNGPLPSESKSVRLQQMKTLARRFSAVLTESAQGDRQEMRLLPTPILRYASKTTGLVDAALFSLAANGTNPDTLILIALQQSAGTDKPVWQYVVVPMTYAAVSVLLDDREVWKKGFGVGASTFFHYSIAQGK